MSTSKTEKNKGGRPRVDATPVTLRLRPDLLAWIDTERAKQTPEPTRPEFIRLILQDRALEDKNDIR